MMQLAGVSNSLSSVVDIDECRSWSSNNCPHICENTRGSYQCSCFSGFSPVTSLGFAVCQPKSDES